MSLASAMFLIAIGAILKWAVTAEVAGVELETVGLILLVVGILGFVIALGLEISARSRAGAPAREERVEYRDRV